MSSKGYTDVDNYDVNLGKLDKWGQQFVERNPGSKLDLCVDEQARFTRMFVDLGTAAQIALRTDIEFSGVDETFFKHVIYKGVVLILVTRDGNNQLLLVGWVVCTTEHADNYNYITLQLKEMAGVESYLNQRRHLVYSDRHKGIPALESHFTCRKAHCIVHIADNVREHAKKIRHQSKLYLGTQYLHTTYVHIT